MGADRITNGPLNTTGTNPMDTQAIVFDQQNNILQTSGATHQLSACQTALYVISAQTALTTITTAQDLISKTLNAGVLNVSNRTLRISGSVIYTSPGTTTPTITINLLLGGVTLVAIVTGAISATASTNMPIRFEFYVTTVTTGSSGTVEAHGNVAANISANTPAAATASYSDTNTAVSSAVDLTSALALKVQIAGSSTITSAQLRLARIEIVN